VFDGAGSPIPTRNVTIFVNGNPIVAAPLDSQGYVLITLNPLAVGDYDIYFYYEGDGNYAPANSNTGHLQVISSNPQGNITITPSGVFAAYVSFDGNSFGWTVTFQLDNPANGKFQIGIGADFAGGPNPRPLSIFAAGFETQGYFFANGVGLPGQQGGTEFYELTFVNGVCTVHFAVVVANFPPQGYQGVQLGVTGNMYCVRDDLTNFLSINGAANTDFMMNVQLINPFP
jgi:hypothetical protein